MTEPEGETFARNRILRTLPDAERRRLASQMELVRFDVRDMVYEQGEQIKHVIFPIDGVLSLVSQMADGRAVEVATVGNEGMIGLPIFLRATQTSAHRAFSQVPGEALRMRSDAFSEYLADGDAGHLEGILHRYTQALISQIAQSAACNMLHNVEQRCSRWLLLTHDRVSTDEFPLTQEFLGQMLGVTRPTVNEVAKTLADEGLIHYRRGRITIRDRQGVEARACECYAVIADEFARLLDAKPKT